MINIISITNAYWQTFGVYNVEGRRGNGNYGRSDAAPFDAIIIIAATSQVPPSLLRQLKFLERMILPIGKIDSVPHLVLIEKDLNGQLNTR